MKKFLKNTPAYLVFLLIFVISTFSTLSVIALNTWNTWFRINPGSTIIVRVSSTQTCRVVSNNGGSSFFIPTKTWGEFNTVPNHPNLSVRNCTARSVWWWSWCSYNTLTSKWCGGYQTRWVWCSDWLCDPWAQPAWSQGCWVTNNTYDYNNCSPWKAYPWAWCARPCSTTYSYTARWKVKYNTDCWGDCDTNDPGELVW